MAGRLKDPVQFFLDHRQSIASTLDWNGRSISRREEFVKIGGGGEFLRVRGGGSSLDTFGVVVVVFTRIIFIPLSNNYKMRGLLYLPSMVELS